MEAEILNDKAAIDNSIEITLRGEPVKLVMALVHGLPRELLTQMFDALNAELAKRQA